MKRYLVFLFFVVLFVVVAAPVFAQNALLPVYRGEAKKSDNRFEFVKAATAYLEDKYNSQSSERVSIPLDYIKIVDDVPKFLKEYAHQANGFKFTDQEIHEVEGNFMTTFGVPPHLPVVINSHSLAWTKAVGLSDPLLRTCILSAALDHELIYHVAYQKTDEVAAHEFERTSFVGCAKNLRVAPDAATVYLKSLDELIVQLKKESHQVAMMKSGR